MIPIILYIIGFFIHNVYLSVYNTFDFEIIQTKYIYVGLTFTIYAILAILFITLSVGNKSKAEKLPWLHLLNWCFKIPTSIFIVYFCLYGFNINIPNEPREDLINKLLHIKILIMFIILH